MDKNNKTDFRTNFDQLIMLFGVALVVGPVTVMNESFILLGLVLAGMAMIALGVWRLGSQLLPERRVYVGLRQEVERFIDLVRRLNAHKISSDAALTIYKSDGGKITVEGSLVPLLGLGVGFEIELDARANIIRYGILLGFSKKEISSRIDKVIKYAELEQFADTKIKNFSSGMFQRLAFATAFQVNPDILLIDESIFVGDLGFQQKCFNTIQSLKNEGKSIIFVSHNMGAIRDFCDRAMFLNNGVAEIIDQPDKVIKYYEDFFSSEKKH